MEWQIKTPSHCLDQMDIWDVETEFVVAEKGTRKGCPLYGTPGLAAMDSHSSIVKCFDHVH